MKNITLTFLLIIPFALFAQSSVRSLNKYMEEAQAGSYQPAPNSVFEDTRNGDKLLEAAATYLTDSVDRIRGKAYSLIKLIGQKNDQLAVRQQAVDLLAGGLQDASSGNVGRVISALTGFNREDFTPNAQSRTVASLNVQAPHVDRLCKLVGYLELQQARGALNTIFTSNTAYKNKWAAQLALARMNDQQAIDYLTNKLASAPINDNFIYDIVPDLVYTRQPEVFEFLETIIFSDQADCRSANPDSDAQILCGYRVLEYIAYAIQDFPIPVDEYGEAIIDDYEQALVDVRAWFDDNLDYGFDRSVF